MKRLLPLLLVPALALLAPGYASADWADNFDSYAAGSGLHGQGGWHGWDGSAAADAFVSNLYSRSAPNSAEITGASDIVHEYAGYTSGVWIYTAWQYIPTAFSGQTYFIMLNTYNDGGPYNWSVQVSFNTNNTVVSDPEGSTLPLIRGAWVELRLEIDLDQNLQTFYYGGSMLYQKSWTEGMSGGGILDIAAIDLYANYATPVYYDDMSLMPAQPTPVESTSWGRIKQIFHE